MVTYEPDAVSLIGSYLEINYGDLRPPMRDNVTQMKQHLIDVNGYCALGKQTLVIERPNVLTNLYDWE